MQSNNINFTRKKVLSAICLIVLLLAFIFACLHKVLPVGRVVVGTFGILTYPLLILLSLVSLASFMGLSYSRRKKPTVYFLIALVSILCAIQSISTFKQLNLVLSFKTLGKYLAYSYTTKITLVGSFGSIFCGILSILLGAMGTIVVYVILATLFIGLFVDYQYYGKYEEPHVKKLKTRVLREKVQKSDKKKTFDGEPTYSFNATNSTEVVGEIVVDENEIDDINSTIYDTYQYSPDEVVGETSEYFDEKSSAETFDEKPISTSSGLLDRSEEKYSNVFTGNDDREKFMKETFGMYTFEDQNQSNDIQDVAETSTLDDVSDGLYGGVSIQEAEDDFASALYGDLEESTKPDDYDKISAILSTTEDDVDEDVKTDIFDFGTTNPLGGFEETGFNQTQTTKPSYLEEKMDEPVFDPNQARFEPASQSNISKRNGGFNTYPQQPPKREIPTFGGFDSGSKSNIVIPQKPIKNGYSFNTAMPGVRYNQPPLNLLQAPKPDTGDYTEEQTRKSTQLEKVLAAFSIPAKVKNIVRGPKITRYELSVPLGVSLKKIPSYEKDIAAALAAKTMTIQAPIPGSPYVGIELENEQFTNVYERELLESSAFQNCKDPLPIAIGKDISGEIIVKSLTKMVHLLIAGSTGSGKSVFIHNIVLSLIYKSSPDNLRLIMIDPKKVEFGRYNGLPHLLTPEVVMGADKAVNALKWCVGEMDRRYDLMQKAGYNNIEPYNKSELVKAGQFEKFPYIVIIVDELAEIMMANKKESEAYIQRISQLARACGMHLVLATQRPSVDIITGVIKTNIPSRISFSLQSGIDSKTILNTVGAEKLLGQGDMLFYPTGTSAMPRLQAAYASDEEIYSVIDYCKQYNTANYDNEIDTIINSEQPTTVDEVSSGFIDAPPPKDALDPYFKSAIKTVMMNNGASVSYLQRRLSIGYSRAARIIDQMADRGFIAPATGAKTRKVLITPEMFREEFGEDYDAL